MNDYYWAEKDLSVKDGVARKAKTEEEKSLPLFEESKQYNQHLAQKELLWVESELQATLSDTLVWLEGGTELPGLRTYRAALRKYYNDVATGVEASRPVFDGRKAWKKVVDFLNKPIF